MARRKLTEEQESLLAQEMERLRDDASAWDFKKPKGVTRRAGASAVLSVRVSVPQLQRLRKVAASQGVGISEILKQALNSYVARSGPQITFNSDTRRWILYRHEPSAVETVQPGADEVTTDPKFFRSRAAERTATGRITA